MTWGDDGVKVITEVATSGELIDNGLETNIPIVSGGPYGVPLNWVHSISNQNPPTGMAEVNWTTVSSTGIFSTSNAAGTGTLGRYYGAFFNVPIDATKLYRVSFSCRMMEGKGQARRSISGEWFNAAGTSLSAVTINLGESNSTVWLDVTSSILTPPANAVTLRVNVSWGLSSIASPPVNWGGQVSSFYISAQDPNPPAIIWKDISCDVKGMTVRYGRERFTNRYDVASATMQLQNDDGDYSYMEPHPFGLRPGRQVRITVTYKGVSYPFYYGIIDSLRDGYTIDGRVVTVVNLLDPTTLMANALCPNIYSAYYVKSGYRVNKLLDGAGYLPRLVDAGQWFVQGIPGGGRSIRDELGVTADSEGGGVFADRLGRVVYKDRTWLTQDLNLQEVTAQLIAQPEDVEPFTTVDNIPTQTTAPNVCGFSLVTDWSRDRVINQVQLANAGGNAETFEDYGSQQRNGILTYQRTDFVLDEYYSDLYGYLETRADDIMGGYSDPVLRVNTFSYHPSATRDNQDNWPWTLSAFMNWLVRVWYMHPINLWGYAVVTRIQSLEHRITPTSWETTLAVDAPVVFTLMAGADSGWDAGIWDVNLWDEANAEVVPSEGAIWNSGQVWNGPGVDWQGRGWSSGNAKWSDPDADWK